MALNAAAALIGGITGWVLRGKGGQPGVPEPVDFATVIDDLRTRKPTTYRVITLDATQAHDEQVVTFSGDNIAVYLDTSDVDFNVRLNEADKDELNISQMKRVSLPFYRFYYSNEAGTGALVLIVSLGGEITPKEDISVETTENVISGTLAERPSPSSDNRLFWATDVKILYRDTGTAWQHVSSQVISGTLASRPAASLLDRYFWATDENILYHDTGSAWEKAAVADHADLDGVLFDAHHGDNGHHGTIAADILANRPAAGTADRMFWATDENILYRDNGAAWEKAAVADHADLDGVTTEDHHGEDHATRHSSGGADPVSHNNLASIGATDHHDNSNDPSAGEKAALAGTSGTPGAGNPYVTDGDPRNTDSREWTGSTVSQAEAEAGTATTRRAWTAQRVKQAIAALETTGPSQATQAAIEAETDENTYIPPDLARHIPGAAKAYCTVASDGTLQSNSYNITSVVKNSTGNYTVTFVDDFSNANYTCAVSIEGTVAHVRVDSPAAGSVTVLTNNAGSSPVLADKPFHFAAFGDQ